MSETSARAANGDVVIAYESIGPGTNEPLLLIMGMGVQRHFWPDGLCGQLVDAGFHVVRFDNRDVGESTHLTAGGTHSMAATVLAPRAARRTAGLPRWRGTARATCR